MLQFVFHFFFFFQIFSEANLPNASMLTFVVVGIWNLLTVIFSLFFVDRFGRRLLMLISLFFMFVGFILITFTYLLFPSIKYIIAILSVLIIVGAFEFGPGPLFFILATEGTK
jgi:MFS family permease